MIVWPVRYINPWHPLLEGHLNFISCSHSLTLSIASPFPYLTLHCTVVSYHTFLQDKLGSCSAPVQTLDQCWLALLSCHPSKYSYFLFPMFCGSFPILSMSLLISSSPALILLLHIPLQAAVFHHHTPICKNLKTFEANIIKPLSSFFIYLDIWLIIN